MKKHVVLILVFSILLIIVFSGCINNSNSEVDKFIGKWETQEGINIEFYNEKECKFIGGEGTWEISNGTIIIVIRFGDGKNTMSYDYVFSDDDEILTLSDVSGRSWIYQKK